MEPIQNYGWKEIDRFNYTVRCIFCGDTRHPDHCADHQCPRREEINTIIASREAQAAYEAACAVVRAVDDNVRPEIEIAEEQHISDVKAALKASERFLFGPGT